MSEEAMSGKLIEAAATADRTRPIRLAIVGSRERSWDAGAPVRALIDEILDWCLHGFEVKKVISGGADGVDTWAAEAARRHGIEYVEYLPANPRWKPDGYRARNRKIAENCTHLLSIRSRNSKTYGSGWTADEAERLGRMVDRYKF